jgi:hypothetical protein
MPQRDPGVYLEDIEHYAAAAVRFTSGFSLEQEAVFSPSPISLLGGVLYLDNTPTILGVYLDTALRQISAYRWRTVKLTRGNGIDWMLDLQDPMSRSW